MLDPRPPRRRLAALLLLLTVAGSGSALAQAGPRAAAPTPPVAKRVPKVDVYHGERRVDDYHWLRQKQDPAVRAYLEAENAYADAVMAPTRAFQEALYQEILSHIKETDVKVPYRDGGYYYYDRTEKGKQYEIRCRKKGSLQAREQIVLDENEMARTEKFFRVDEYRVSDDGNRLAYSTDTTGFREYTLRVKDLRTGRLGPESIPKVASVAWARDNATLFYVVEDHAKRPYRLYRHRVGTPAAKDTLVYEEPDERFRLGVVRSRSREYLFLAIGSMTTSEVRYLRAATPLGEWKIVEPRAQDHEYDVGHHGDRLYIRSNSTGRNFALFSTPVGSPGRAHWVPVVPHRPDVMLEDVQLFADHYVMLLRRGGLPHLRVVSFRTGEAKDIAFGEPTYDVEPDTNRVWKTTAFRYRYQSLITPRSVFDYDTVTHQSKLLKQTEVPGGFDRANYASEFIAATARDGAKIPISIAYRKGTKRDGTSPLFLAAYGAYGLLPYSSMFRERRLVLLDRGVTVAFAHVRGGGEKGKPWHDAGRMMNKRNTFTDFIAVAEHLVKQRYAARDKLAITGGSAGGLLMGAVTNLRPDLFRVVLNQVPFVDVINTMMDKTLPLTVTEFEEWGNPAKKAEYDHMRTYCPYSNLRRGAYPAILVTTSFNDSQVMYWEPAKYTAKLRTLKTDRNPLLLKTNLAAGHSGASGRYDNAREDAFEYAFVLWQLRITK
jgi:oligopeptidase B